jgi:hypothetical protein
VGESLPYDVQYQAKRRRVHTVLDPELLAIGQNQFQRRPGWQPFSEERTVQVRSFAASCANSKNNDLRRLVLCRTPGWFARWPPAAISLLQYLRFSSLIPQDAAPQLAAEGWIIKRLRRVGIFKRNSIERHGVLSVREAEKNRLAWPSPGSRWDSS